MSMILVDAMGDACPIPVVKTKNAIRDLAGAEGTVKTLVDNEIAVQNLTKMAVQKGYGVSSEKLGENQYAVVMEIAASADQPAAAPQEEPAVCIPDSRRKNTVVVISSNRMGHGNDELGAVLIKGFIFALSQQDELPSCILFYNGGVQLTCEESPALEDLKSLEAQGVEILSCGTCLNYYGLTEKLQVGSVTNMYTIVEKMSGASLILKP